MLKRNFAYTLITFVLLIPVTTHAGFWSTITGWFSGDDVYVADPVQPTVIPEPVLEPEVLPEEVSVPATPVQKPSVPAYTPPAYLPPTTAGMTFVGGITPAQLKSAIESLRDELEPQIDRAMDSPRPRGERSDDDSISIEEGPDGYILQSTGDDVEWVSPSSLSTADGTFSTTSANYWKSILNFFSTTSADYWFDQQSIPGDGTFSTTSANYWKSLTNFFSTTSADAYIAASTTIAASGNATLGDVLYWNGSRWTPLATSSLGISGGVSGYSTIQDEASSLTQRATLNFTGAGVSCSDNAGSGRTDCTIAGGGVSDENAPYGQYDPYNPPSSCAVCDEFTGGESLSGTNGNPDASSYTFNNDNLYIEGDGTNEEHVRAYSSPSSGNTDFTVTTAVWANPFYLAANDGCGLGVIEAGTIAAPTQYSMIQIVENGANDLVQTFTAPSAYAYGSASVLGTYTTQWAYYVQMPVWFQIDYTDSSRSTEFRVSYNGIDFFTQGTRTLSADPAYFFLSARDAGKCRFLFVRARTDADRDLAGE